MILLAKPLRRVLSACVTSRELFGLRSDSRGFNICSAPASQAGALANEWKSLVQIGPPQPTFHLLQSLPQTLQPSEFVTFVVAGGAGGGWFKEMLSTLPCSMNRRQRSIPTPAMSKVFAAAGSEITVVGKSSISSVGSRLSESANSYIRPYVR
jgi:hypothetical protein